MLEELLSSGNYRSISLHLRHNPDGRSQLLELTNHINDNSLLKNNELTYIIINDLKEIPECVCGKKLSYVKPTIGYKTTCGDNKCVNTVSSQKRIVTNNEKYGGNSPANSQLIINKMKNTVKERYGVDCVYDIPFVKEKIVETNQKKYGTEWSSQSIEIKNKSKLSVINKWGVDCTQKIPEIREKTKQTNLNKWGTEETFSSDIIRDKINETNKLRFGGHPSKNSKIREKTKQSNIEKWGFEHPNKSSEIREKIGTTNTLSWLKRIGLGDSNFIRKDDDGYYVLFCESEGKEYKINPVTYNRRKRNGETVSIYLNPLIKSFSIGEVDLFNFIKTIYDGEILTNDRLTLNGYEIDILLPELGIGIEYNGMYYHSEDFKPKKYHQSKYIRCKNKNIRLIQIWEDEWVDYREKIESYLKHVLKKTQNTVYGRNCSVKFITTSEYRDFCEDNHLQGYARAKHKIGLFYNNTLVSIMSFCTPRVKSKISVEFEMIRFCNKLDYNVVGGGSKLFKFFIKTIKPKSIITYSDLDKFNSSFYEKLGFTFDGITQPGFFYYNGSHRTNRFTLRKQIITNKKINMDNQRKIYNSGNGRWFWFS